MVVIRLEPFSGVWGSAAKATSLVVVLWGVLGRFWGVCGRRPYLWWCYRGVLGRSGKSLGGLANRAFGGGMSSLEFRLNPYPKS